MGLEATCRLRLGRRVYRGTALLETRELRFRGDTSVTVPFEHLANLRAAQGWLMADGPDGPLALELGKAAGTWLLKIRYPRSRLDKLGVKPDSSVSVLGVDDETFLVELAGRTASIAKGRMKTGADLVFLGARAPADLDPLPKLRDAMARNGAIWVVWPKGRRELREDDVRRAAKFAGLVDVKVVAFSDASSALKLVIPVAHR
jgi:hypothetical protein